MINIKKYGNAYRIQTDKNFYVLSVDGSSKYESEDFYKKLLKSKFRPIKGPMSMSYYFKYKDIHDELVDAVKEGNIDNIYEFKWAESLLEIRTIIKQIKNKE